MKDNICIFLGDIFILISSSMLITLCGFLTSSLIKLALDSGEYTSEISHLGAFLLCSTFATALIKAKMVLDLANQFNLIKLATLNFLSTGMLQHAAAFLYFNQDYAGIDPANRNSENLAILLNIFGVSVLLISMIKPTPISA